MRTLLTIVVSGGLLACGALCSTFGVLLLGSAGNDNVTTDTTE